MSNAPDSLKYTKEHEWVELRNDNVVRVGITDFAQNSLGDIVYLSLPEVGRKLTAGDTCGEVESTKSVSDIYAPVSGEVVAINGDAVNEPSVINTSPYENGWLFDVALANPSDVETLLSAAAYLELTN